MLEGGLGRVSVRRARSWREGVCKEPTGVCQLTDGQQRLLGSRNCRSRAGSGAARMDFLGRAEGGGAVCVCGAAMVVN